MNFTAWKIWGEAGSWKRDVLPIVGAAIVGIAIMVFTKDSSMVTAGSVACVVALVYVPLAILVTFGPFHRKDK